MNKTSQQGHYILNAEEEANPLIGFVWPRSDEPKDTKFESVMAYDDGVMEIVTTASVVVSIVLSGACCAHSAENIGWTSVRVSGNGKAQTRSQSFLL